jgi:hypothetical protein
MISLDSDTLKALGVIILIIAIYTLVQSPAERFTVFNAYHGEHPPFITHTQNDYVMCVKNCTLVDPTSSIIDCERKCREKVSM